MLPNIVITGTPGCGKTTLAAELVKLVPGTVHIDLSKVIKEKKLYSEWDDELNSAILDEDLVADYLDDLYESRIDQGGIVLDFHSPGLLPVEFFDRVFVLRCETAVLYDRLQARGYSKAKIDENIDCEIFGSSVDEAKDVFEPETVQEISSNMCEDTKENLKTISDFLSRDD